MSIQTIQTKLRDSYTYIVAPKSMLDVPVELPDMAKVDEEGNPDGYYTLNEISQALGNQFTFTDKIDDRFCAFRWSINYNGVEGMIITYLKSKGLVDMRDNGIADSLNYEVDEIDFDSLNGNEFGIFNMLEIKQVPNVETDESN